MADWMDRTLEEATPPGAGNVTLLDLILVASESVRTILLGTLASAGLAYGVAFLMPETYTSETYLAPHLELDPERVIATLQAASHSPLVLDALLKKYPEEGSTQEARRQKLSKRFFLPQPWQKPTGILTLQVSSDEPGRAQSLANDFIDAWLDTTKARGPRKEFLDKELEAVKLEMALARRFTESIASARGEQQVQYPLQWPDLAAQMRAREASLAELAGISRSIIVSPPDRPTEAIWPRKWQIAVLGAAAGLTAILLIVFTRLGLRMMTQDPRSGAELRRIANNLTLWRRRKSV